MMGCVCATGTAATHSPGEQKYHDHRHCCIKSREYHMISTCIREFIVGCAATVCSAPFETLHAANEQQSLIQELLSLAPHAGVSGFQFFMCLCLVLQSSELHRLHVGHRLCSANFH